MSSDIISFPVSEVRIKMDDSHCSEFGLNRDLTLKMTLQVHDVKYVGIIAVTMSAPSYLQYIML